MLSLALKCCARKVVPRSAIWFRPIASAAVYGGSLSEFDHYFIDYFNLPDINGHELRHALAELHSYDVVPEPEVVRAALLACRRTNDFALCIRFLEAIKIKCGSKKNRAVVYGNIVEELRPFLKTLGISTPEELGLDKPEFEAGLMLGEDLDSSCTNKSSQRVESSSGFVSRHQYSLMEMLSAFNRLMVALRARIRGQRTETK